MRTDQPHRAQAAASLPVSAHQKLLTCFGARIPIAQAAGMLGMRETEVENWYLIIALQTACSRLSDAAAEIRQAHAY